MKSLDYVMINGGGGMTSLVQNTGGSNPHESILNFKLIRDNLSSFIDPSLIDSMSEEEIEVHLMKIMNRNNRTCSIQESDHHQNDISMTQIFQPELDSNTLNYIQNPDVIPMDGVNDQTLDTFYCNFHPPCSANLSDTSSGIGIESGLCDRDYKNNQELVVNGSNECNNTMKRKGRSMKSVTFDSSLDSSNTTGSGCSNGILTDSTGNSSSSMAFPPIPNPHINHHNHHHPHVHLHHQELNDGSTQQPFYGHTRLQKQAEFVPKITSSEILCNDGSNSQQHWSPSKYSQEGHPCEQKQSMDHQQEQQLYQCLKGGKKNFNPNLSQIFQTRHNHNVPNWPSSSNCSSSSSPSSLLMVTPPYPGNCTSSANNTSSYCDGHHNNDSQNMMVTNNGTNVAGYESSLLDPSMIPSTGMTLTMMIDHSRDFGSSNNCSPSSNSCHGTKKHFEQQHLLHHSVCQQNSGHYHHVLQSGHRPGNMHINSVGSLFT